MFTKNVMKYSVFKNLFKDLSQDEKDFLFYWSLIDASTWEEVPIYFPDLSNGHKEMLPIFKKDAEIKATIEADEATFLNNFCSGESLANFILAGELELKLGDSWILDESNLNQTIWPDIIFKNKDGLKADLEIKRLVSAANLFNRINEEVRPNLGGDNCNNFLLLLLFPIFPKEHPQRINQLIEGYHVYEKILESNGKKRQVLCQCFTANDKERVENLTLNNLAERIVNKFFKDLK